MKSFRLEAFSDAVIAIIITIMALELIPAEHFQMEQLHEMLPIFLAYVFSYIMIGIYWLNHHHLLHITEKVNGRALWVNLILLFFISLIPITTHLLGQHYTNEVAVFLYALNLTMCSLFYILLEKELIKIDEEDGQLSQSISIHYKEKITLGIYVIAMGLSFVNTWIVLILLFAISIIWITPDLRVEKNIN